MTIILTNGTQIPTLDCQFGDNDEICCVDMVTQKEYQFPLDRVDDIEDGFVFTVPIKIVN